MGSPVTLEILTVTLKRPQRSRGHCRVRVMALLSDIHTECRSEWMKRVLEKGYYKKAHTFYFSKMGITEAGMGIVHTYINTHKLCKYIDL